MKVALVHDYLREYGGAERVVEDLHEIFPDAPIYTSYYNPEGLGIHNERIKKWKIKTSWMQNVPFANTLISPFRIFAPLMFESFDLSAYDVVISSDAIYFAKSVLTGPKQLHISYIHTPPRYLYGYTTSYNYKKHWWTRVLGEVANHFLRIYDFEVSQRPDILVANSENVKQRIQKFYRRDATVIYPGTDLQPFKKAKKTIGDYYVHIGRLVRSKQVEIAIQACNELKLPLKVAGTGPMLEELRVLAGETVEMMGSISDQDRVKLLAGAKAVLLLEEAVDFGITAVEAQAAGTPVIAVRAGGYLETVVEGKTGVFIEKSEVASLKAALETFDARKYKEGDCRKNAERFSKANFKKQLLLLIDANNKAGIK